MEKENWKVYINGEIVPLKEAKISVFDRVFSYGDAVFEGIRCYDGKIFKLEEHVRRLFDSAQAVHIKIPLSHEDMKKAIKATVRANGFKNAHIKPFVTRGCQYEMTLDTNKAITPSIVIMVRPHAESTFEKAASGIRLAAVSVRKIPACCIDPRIKSVNYMTNILARAEALASGADDAIMLDIQGFVSEGPGTNIFLVRRGTLQTPPVQSGLEGITRQTVIMLGKKIPIPTYEIPLTMYDVYTSDEIFMTGTGAGIVPAIEVDRKSIGEGKRGPITQKLIQLYAEEVKKGEAIE